MECTKHIVESSIFARMAHADVSWGAPPLSHAFVIFGGSGVDEEEYIRRSKTVIPIFDSLLNEQTNRNFLFAYVSAPYDVPFRRFQEDPKLAEPWNRHVLVELFGKWSTLPFFVCGFSGGNSLAFNGVHADPRCFGGACLGGDALPQDFSLPEQWREPLKIYSASNDDVANHPHNRSTFDALATADVAEQFVLRSGRHRLKDYATHECLGRLFVEASKMAGALENG